MPWIKEELCVGCGLCVNDCPVEAIAFDDAGKAVINEQDCIRCSRCHSVCPKEAVRHDGEKIPFDVANNVEWALGLLKHYESAGEQQGFLERVERYFNKQSKVASLSAAEIAAKRAKLS